MEQTKAGINILEYAGIIFCNKICNKIIKKLKFESNFCWFSEDIFGKIPVQISIIFCTQKTERQKFIDFGQNILWALCEWNAMINTLKYTK